MDWFNGPPPNFYLTHDPTTSLFLFIDVVQFPENYNSSPVAVPLANQNTPYRGQGYGGGWQWQLNTRINAWNAFRSNGSSLPNTSIRQGQIGDPHRQAYDDYLALKGIIRNYGPSPIFSLHMPTPSAVSTGSSEVMLTDLAFSLSPRQSLMEESGEIFPNVIEVQMTLVEYIRYHVGLG